MKSRLLLVPVLVLVVAGTAIGAWVGLSDRKASLLSDVPADTVAFIGYNEPVPLETLTSILPGGYPGLEAMPPAADMDPEAATREAGPAAGVLAALGREYLASLGEDDYPLQRFGIGDGLAFGVYAVRALPVLRLGIDDREAFHGVLDRAEAAAGVQGTPFEQGDARGRRYTIPTRDEGTALDLVVATHRGFAVFTLAGTGIDEASLATALGTATPGRSLADSGRIADLAKRYGTTPGTTGFIDHEALVAGLTGAEDSRLAAMLGEIASAWGASDDYPLPGLSDPACRKDARAIAAKWPHTVMGLTELDANTRRLGSRTVIAATDTALMNEIARLRGHIPNAMSGRPLAGLGLGLDVSQLVPVIQGLAQRFTQAPFECPAIRAAQQRLASQPLGQMGMFTAMIGDVRGISLALESLRPSQGGGAPVSGDGVIEIATGKPQVLWQMAQSSLGLPADQAPSMGGPAVDVPQAMAPDTRVRAALRENALVLLLGDSELTDAAGETDVEPNGVFSLRYDYGRAMALMSEHMDEAGADEKRMFRALGESDLYYDLGMDITERGFRLDLTLTPGD